MIAVHDEDWSISVSTDEKWLVFWELSEGSEQYGSHVTTLDLNDYVSTHHRIDKAYDQLSSHGHLEPWEQVGLGFNAAGWLDGRWHVVVFVSTVRKCLAFSPGVIEAEWTQIPLGLTCSDCPSPRRVEALAVNLVGQWLLSYGTRFSVARKNGQIGRSIYHLDPRGDGVCIAKTDSSGSETVIRYPRRRFHNTELITLRVSPDERYLAYGLLTELRAPIPLPDQEIKLHILDLAKGKDYTISSGYRYISNLIWSPDSERLYFAGFQGEQRAVYRVDVAAILEGR
jgi:hypothetical protein